MKIVRHFLIIALLLVACLPSCGSSQTRNAEEDGWKNLKWGMRLQEIKDNYVNEVTGQKCTEISEKPVFTAEQMTEFEKKSIYPEMRKVTRVFCDGQPAGILMYKGTFVEKTVDLDKLVARADGGIGQEELNAYENNILKKLKEIYPKGKIGHIETKNLFGIIHRIPTFEYHSDKIVVLSGTDPNSFDLKFFEANFNKMADDEDSNAIKVVKEAERKANEPKNPF